MVWIWVEREGLRSAVVGFGFKERGAKIDGDLKQINDEPGPFALPSDVFGPCGGGDKSDLAVEDRPWRATPRSFRMCLLFCCYWICSKILGIFC